MSFKSDKQRKKVMSKLSKINAHTRYSTEKEDSYWILTGHKVETFEDSLPEAKKIAKEIAYKKKDNPQILKRVGYVEYKKPKK